MALIQLGFALFHSTLDLGPSSKVALRLLCPFKEKGVKKVSSVNLNLGHKKFVNPNASISTLQTIQYPHKHW